MGEVRCVTAAASEDQYERMRIVYHPPPHHHLLHLYKFTVITAAIYTADTRNKNFTRVGRFPP